MSCGVCVGGFRELGLGIINGKKKGNEKDIKKTSKHCDKPPERHFFSLLHGVFVLLSLLLLSASRVGLRACTSKQTLSVFAPQCKQTLCSDEKKPIAT